MMQPLKSLVFLKTSRSIFSQIYMECMFSATKRLLSFHYQFRQLNLLSANHSISFSQECPKSNNFELKNA